MLDFCIGMMGSPGKPTTVWTDEKLIELKAQGFNTIQLNIAWGCRPNDEPLNLEDVLVLPEQTQDQRQKAEERRNRICKRIAMCKRHGLRTLFHFGAPFNGLEPYQGKPPQNCFHDTIVRVRYETLLEKLNAQIPGIDDILVYTYDQDAWLCSEFSDCKNCRGIPLHRRLPDFLHTLHAKWISFHEEGLFWWEPWELSSGQVQRMVEELPIERFGLMLHSNIGEVQKARAVDLWFRNTVMLAHQRGIPVVAELFLGEASEETEPLLRIPCPRLTYEQIKAVLSVPGVIGIKEYYGLQPGENDPCLLMVGEVLRHPNYCVQDCLALLAAPYGDNSEAVLQLWENVAQAYTLYPWDVSWFARELGRATVDHGWSAAFLRGQQCSTPSWDSSRHAVFMKTDDDQPHPWMLEDVHLRFELSARRMEQAEYNAQELCQKLCGDTLKQMQETKDSLGIFRRLCMAHALHLRETNVAMLLRESNQQETSLSQVLVEEMEDLLRRDCENQQGKGRVVQIAESYRKDPQAWLAIHLLVQQDQRIEQGHYALTTR